MRRRTQEQLIPKDRWTQCTCWKFEARAVVIVNDVPGTTRVASRDGFFGVALETFEAGCAVRVGVAVTLTPIQFTEGVGRASQISLGSHTYIGSTSQGQGS